MSGTVVFFFFFTSLYLRRILWRIRIVFARPHENSKTIGKTMEIRCMASSFSTTSVSSVHTKTTSWCLQKLHSEDRF